MNMPANTTFETTGKASPRAGINIASNTALPSSQMNLPDATRRSVFISVTPPKSCSEFMSLRPNSAPWEGAD